MRYLVIVALVCGVARADEDKDLALVPDAASEPAAAPTTSALEAKLYADEAATLATNRTTAVPFPAPAPTDLQTRTSFDASLHWRGAADIALVLSDRVDVIAQQGSSLWSRRTVTNELREAYASWEPFDGSYLEAGRINVRSGSALGFNPTDFLRPRTLVGQASLDPSVLRVNRLGTAMIRAQMIWAGGAASVVYAPKLFEPPPIGAPAVGVDPQLDATNATHRGLVEIDETFGDLAVQALGYLESGRSKLGVELTQPIGDSVIAYAEWAGGFDHDLIERAIELGGRTGTLPMTAPVPIPTPASRGFDNDLAAGASWTIAAAVTVNVEYHLHQGGLSRADWNHWFDAGRANPMLAGELWYIRGYANDQLEPATMHEAFIRADWPKAFVDHLELTGFAFVDLLDGSVLSQVTASFYASDAWTAALSISGALGGARSERGSLPQVGSAIAEIVRYF
jgi:hypothetical protein